jgi:hypothetical protein
MKDCYKISEIELDSELNKSLKSLKAKFKARVRVLVNTIVMKNLKVQAGLNRHIEASLLKLGMQQEDLLILMRLIMNNQM